MSVKEDQLNILAGVNSDMPLLESPQWPAVYAPQLRVGENEVFRMVNWDTVMSLLDSLHEAVRDQIQGLLDTVGESDEEALIAARKKVTEETLWQAYGSDCRFLDSVDKQGNTVQPSAISFPLAVRFRRKKW